MAPPSHFIERAEPHDGAAIRALIEAAYAGYVPRLGKPPAPMLADHAASIAAGEVEIIRIDGEIVAAIRTTHVGDALQLDDLAVDPAIRSRGLGRRMVEHAESRARALGLSAVTLHTNAAMHEAIAFYGRLGFREMGRATRDGYDRVFFRKDLP